MKIKDQSIRKCFYSLLLVSLPTIAGLSSFDSNPVQAVYKISGNATGAQVVPSVSVPGTGTITGTYDPGTRLLNYTSTWTNLTAAPAKAGFYTGAVGVNGIAAGDPWSMGTNNQSAGNITGKLTLTEAQAKDLLAGNWYYLYATIINADGEIRGQISAVPQ